MATRLAASRIAAQMLPGLSAAFLKQQERKPEKPDLTGAWREVDPYWNVSVKVLHAKNIPKCDFLSESDCYVQLRLPSASSRTLRTRSVVDSPCPKWNETFRFRIRNHVKNILELKVCDEDSLSSDDLYSTVLFDINNLCPGKKETKVFRLDSKDKAELWVEFEVEESDEPPGEYITNGVLVTGPFSPVEVTVETSKENAKEDLVVKLDGAYEEEQVSNPASGVPRPLRFFVNRDLETELAVKLTSLQNNGAKEEGKDEIQDVLDRSSVLLKSRLPEQEVKFSMPLGEDKVDLLLKTNDGSEELDVRLGFDIPTEEKEFLEKRRPLVAQAIQRALGLRHTPEPQKLPVVAVVASGGGTRAMTALYGSLKGLQMLGVLDAVSYISGVSGSTWAMSSLYDNANWSQLDMATAVSEAGAEISKSFYSLGSPGQLKYYAQQLQQRAGEGQLVSFIDVFGLVLEFLIYGKNHPSTLSSQQRAVAAGQNPYPIYTAVNVKEGIKGCTPVSEWCEFTPYEVGMPKYGAFVRAQDFGSEFYMGHLIKRHPETRISFLLGLWSSILSINLTDVLMTIIGSVPSWMSALDDNVNSTDGADGGSYGPSRFHTYLIKPVGDLANTVDDFLTDRPILSQNYNFLRGFSLHRDYSVKSGFMTWKDTHLDAFPNCLTPSDSKLHLVDSGFTLNAGFPPVTRPERNVDLILSFNYSWNKDQFKVLMDTAQYCEDNHQPFPRIDFSSLQREPLKECYVFKDDDNPRAPIVLHFPLINVTFREFRAPGERRVGEAELREGDVDVSSSSSPYRTQNLTYTQKDFEQLVALACYNAVNNKETILQALQLSLDRSASSEGSSLSTQK